MTPPVLADGDLCLQLNRTVDGDKATGAVATYYFDMRVGDQVVGGIRFRAQTTPEVELFAGHFGYNVDPDFRGRHYAERACRLLLPFAAAHGLTTIWITCAPGNSASRRTCERLGAQLVDIVLLPPDSDWYGRGERSKCRYRLVLA